MGHGLRIFPSALTVRSCQGMNSNTIFFSSMVLCPRTLPLTVMVVVGSSRCRMLYYAPKGVLFWHGTPTLLSNEATLQPGP